ncbi:MAG: RNA polymerase sigma factor [Myxococcota bacterium]
MAWLVLVTLNSSEHPDLGLIAAAIRREPAAARALIKRLTPVVQARVVRCLLRSSAGRGRNARQEVADLCQDTFRILFDDDAKVLRRWDPNAGLSLDNFVGLVAKRHALSILRSKKRSPWSDDPVEDVERLITHNDGPESIVVTQDALAHVIDELEAELSPKGWVLFQRIFVDEADIPELVTELGMTRDAIYAWRSRLGKLVRQKVSAVMSDSPSPLRTSVPEGDK